jgi:hypothetical protein
VSSSPPPEPVTFSPRLPERREWLWLKIVATVVLDFLLLAGIEAGRHEALLPDGGGDVQNSGGAGYRPPTEAEWEYACRAGSATRYSFGDDAVSLDESAWFRANSGAKTHSVVQKRPIAWGLFDMHGNLWEWCGDWCDETYFHYSPGADPLGPSKGATRVFRDRCWLDYPPACRSVLERARTANACELPRFSCYPSPRSVVDSDDAIEANEWLDPQTVGAEGSRRT